MELRPWLVLSILGSVMRLIVAMYSFEPLFSIPKARGSKEGYPI